MLKKLKKENKKDLDILERAIASRINQLRMRVDALQNNLDFESLRTDGLAEQESELMREVASLRSDFKSDIKCLRTDVQVLLHRTSVDYTSFAKKNEEEPKDGN